jgi:hypothetical protein
LDILLFSNYFLPAWNPDGSAGQAGIKTALQAATAHESDRWTRLQRKEHLIDAMHKKHSN